MRPQIPNSGVFVPDFQGGPRNFAPPDQVAARKAVALSYARDANGTEVKNIASILHINWGPASARQLKKISVIAEGAKGRLPACVAEVEAVAEGAKGASFSCSRDVVGLGLLGGDSGGRPSTRG